MESEGKPQNNDRNHKEDLREGLEDVAYHENVDAEEGKLPDIGEEVHPGYRHGEGAQLPLPAQSKPGPLLTRREVQDEDDGQDVGGPLDRVLVVAKVGEARGGDLKELLQDVQSPDDEHAPHGDRLQERLLHAGYVLNLDATFLRRISLVFVLLQNLLHCGFHQPMMRDEMDLVFRIMLHFDIT